MLAVTSASDKSSNLLPRWGKRRAGDAIAAAKLTTCAIGRHSILAQAVRWLEDRAIPTSPISKAKEKRNEYVDPLACAYDSVAISWNDSPSGADQR